MEVPNEPGLSPNNGLENAFLSDQSMASKPRKGQTNRFGAAAFQVCCSSQLKLTATPSSSLYGGYR